MPDQTIGTLEWGKKTANVVNSRFQGRGMSLLLSALLTFDGNRIPDEFQAPQEPKSDYEIGRLLSDISQNLTLTLTDCAPNHFRAVLLTTERIGQQCDCTWRVFHAG